MKEDKNSLIFLQILSKLPLLTIHFSFKLLTLFPKL